MVWCEKNNRMIFIPTESNQLTVVESPQGHESAEASVSSQFDNSTSNAWYIYSVCIDDFVECAYQKSVIKTLTKFN